MGKIKEFAVKTIDKAKETGMSVLNWMAQNKELTVVMAPLAASFIGGGVKVARDLSRKHDIRRMKALKTHYVYDPSNGIYLKLRRSLRNADAVKLAELRKKGLTVTEALNKMHLLQGR